MHLTNILQEKRTIFNELLFTTALANYSNVFLTQTIDSEQNVQNI
jgi:hypothetical protein